MTHEPYDAFELRHIGPRGEDIGRMLGVVGAASLDALVDEVVPPSIRSPRPLNLPVGLSEHEFLQTLSRIAGKNRVRKSYIGLGYYDTITPPVILRNVMENPGWYTPYTPYQAEIAQGRLESLLNFQTMVTDLTGMEVANASLLDEPTAAAEAMTLLHRVQPKRHAVRNTFLVSSRTWPQTRAVIESRAEPLGIHVRVVDPAAIEFDETVFGLLVQYPDERGAVEPLAPLMARAHEAGVLVAVATDLLALTLLTPPGDAGADVVVGNSQRFGVPLGYGGPHAAFFATRETFVRQMPGRIIGVSVDSSGRPAYRMALQTREQHIRREKATSNICTAQALLANMAAMYAVYHGPSGLTAIAVADRIACGVAREGVDEPRLSSTQRHLLRHAADRSPRRARRQPLHARGTGSGRRHELPLGRRRHDHDRARRDGGPGRRRSDRGGVLPRHGEGHRQGVARCRGPSLERRRCRRISRDPPRSCSIRSSIAITRKPR